MKSLTLNSNKNSEINMYSDMPVIYIGKINFISNDENWVGRLITASLTVKMSCIDIKDIERSSYQEAIVLGIYITPMHRNAVLEANRTIRYGGDFAYTQQSTITHKCKNWKVAFELNNLSFLPNESLTIEYLDKEYIIKRIEDWKDRINKLYIQIQNWLTGYTFKKGNPVDINEELMGTFEVKAYAVGTADIYKGNNFVASIKPIGLWVIGANGRINIWTKQGSYILVDHSSEFQAPQWYIYDMNRKWGNTHGSQRVTQGISFGKETLLNII